MRKLQGDYSGKKVLVVDDYPLNHEILSALLEPTGMIVAHAYDGEEVPAMIEKMEFDLIIMDIMMPKVDGLEATRRIRSMSKYGKTVPIIALTANAEPQDLKKCQEVGMDGFITKPIKSDDLDAIFGEHLV